MKGLIFLVVFLLSLSAYAELNFVTYNIRSFRGTSSTDLRLLNRTLNGTDFDLVAVQEIKNVDALKEFTTKYFPGYEARLSNCGGAGGQKLGFIYNAQKLELIESWEDGSISNSKIEKACSGRLRPAFFGHFKEKKTKIEFVAASLHLKCCNSSSRRARQLEILTNSLRKVELKYKKPFVLMGDFNTVEFLDQDQGNISYFKNFIAENNLINMSDRLSPEQKCSSYWYGGSRDGNEHPSMLDHILVSESLVQNARSEVRPHAHCLENSCEITPIEDMAATYTSVSDHCPIQLKLQR